MRRACIAYWGVERCIQGFGGETWGERDHLEDPGVDSMIILRWIFRKWDGGDMDWIDVVQEIGFHKMWGIS